jgi:hypothetical protein
MLGNAERQKGGMKVAWRCKLSERAGFLHSSLQFVSQWVGQQFLHLGQFGDRGGEENWYCGCCVP